MADFGWLTLPPLIETSDRLLFYFAGHGIALNGEDGPEGYLIPQDARLGKVVDMEARGAGKFTAATTVDSSSAGMGTPATGKISLAC
ncbi:MAG: hypothetical protein MJA27_10755 [Pseudanabaenales cyanobacterium]|nr:hypothetical protein [Pseudanabaenales cyanobacterium]